jgi:hypothetical protein
VCERDDEMIERMAAALRHPVYLDPAFDARVMARVRVEGRGSRVEETLPALPTRAWRWFARPRTVRVSPIAGLAAAAAIAAVVALGRTTLGERKEVFAPVAVNDSPRNDTPRVRAVPSTLDPRPSPLVQFVLVAPDARGVSLVGDFNDWDVAATQLRPAAAGGVWTIEVPLAPGRHRYAFVVDGKRWLADPAAPRAVDDDFGTPSSVVTISERGA